MPDLATEKIFANQTIGDVTYTVVVLPLGFEMHSMLWDLMSNYNVDRAGRQGADVQIGRAKDTVYINAIKSLKVEGEEVAIRQDYALGNLPKYDDMEYMGTFPNRLLEHILEVNPFIGLAKDAPFTMIFRPYLPEELRQQQDPTQSGAQTPTDSPDTSNQEQNSEEEGGSTNEPTSTSARLATLPRDQQSEGSSGTKKGKENAN